MAFLYKINSYFLITGVVAKDSLVEAVVSDSELQILYKNSILYVDDVRYEYSINEVMLGAIKRNNTVYNLVYIIKLFIFAAQTGNATRCPTLLQEGRRGESE